MSYCAFYMHDSTFVCCSFLTNDGDLVDLAFVKGTPSKFHTINVSKVVEQQPNKEV